MWLATRLSLSFGGADTLLYTIFHESRNYLEDISFRCRLNRFLFSLPLIGQRREKPMCSACKRGLPFWIGLLILSVLAWQAIPATERTGDSGSKSYQKLTIEQAEKWINEGALVIDVREPFEFAEGHIPQAKNIPLGELSRRLDEVPKDKRLVLVCRSGNRSSKAARLLLDQGYPPDAIGNLEGGMLRWQAEGKPIER
jgi:rhodanese-related sulfurtransferase